MRQGAELPLVRDLVLVGGGHAHALVLRMWAMDPVPGVRLSVINPGTSAPYSGMLPGHVAGHYDRAALEIDLVRLARFAGARLIPGAAEGIDRAARRIHVPGRPPVAYDIASLDIGVTSNMPQIPGFDRHGIPAKPLAGLADAWAGVCAGAGPVRICVIGAGVAGAELALAARHRMAAMGRAAEVHLIDRGPALSGLAPRAALRLRAVLAERGITLIEEADPVEVGPDLVHLSDGQAIPADVTIGAAGARPHPWVAELGLDTVDGFLVVDKTLRSVGDPAIFGAGDCIHLAHAPRPKAGVFAVRAAPVLHHNLRAALTGGRTRRFRPQGDYLKLISLGRRAALAEKWGLAVSGPLLWRWKDRIDRRFMNRFRDLAPMQPPALPRGAATGMREALGTAPPCGGCGAKLGREALTTALARLPSGKRADLLTRSGDDAAVLAHGDRRQVLTTDHLRAFTEDPVLLARVAAIHAMGDIWAMGARPQAALASVILPRMTPQMQGAWLDEIMAAAAAVFGAEGAEIAGGHSSMGNELTIGFTATGTLDGPPIALSGARPGDALILTKALGTGILLAAEMQMKARGADVAAACAQMCTPSGAAASILGGAQAMTDVTGFGLAGHLMSLCEASDTGAEIDLSALPVLAGAGDLAAAGVRSTLEPENRAALAGRIEHPKTARAALLFDPQTSGGLLAAVPATEAIGLVSRLCRAGCDATQVVGRIVEGPPRIVVR